ncbi:MAG: redox-regulated ATPase YchF [Actinobacteria bacterium]|nr:redox-regulated ATPase YchF [Actinomycetota bacterium]
MRDVGLVGLPFSGKSTLFTALTRTGAAGGRDNQAVVPVPDPRLPVLAELERSARIVPAQVRFVDVPGALSARGLAALRETDALCVVLRAFGPDPDPGRELAEITAELVLADLANVESALEGARKRSRGRGQGADREAAALERALAALSAETLLGDAGLDEEDRAHLRALAPLTLKPWIVVANLEEGTELPAGLPDGTVGVYASIEAETAAMPEDEARALLEEFGVARPGLEAVIAACYRALDLITFLTTGEDESRAWEVRRGATAPEAAGVIHTDLQRGFIRAEVVSYDDVVAAGGWDAAKVRGLMRVEGKDYEVQEGDVLHVRFSV